MGGNGEAFAYADALHTECASVAEFIDRVVRPIVDRHPEKLGQRQAYFGVLLRVTGWLRSIAKLNDPADFQATVAGARALYEIAIDLTLRAHAPAAHPHAMLAAWDRSAKLESSERAKKFYETAAVTVPAEHLPMIDYVEREGAAIRAERAAVWPDRDATRHPPRWTGRQNLRKDAEAADLVAPYKLEEFYVTRFGQLCWNTHGSGLAGVGYITADQFPLVSALALSEIARFAALSAALVLRLFDAYDGIAEVRLELLEKERLRVRALVIRRYPAAWAKLLEPA